MMRRIEANPLLSPYFPAYGVYTCIRKRTFATVADASNDCFRGFSPRSRSLRSPLRAARGGGCSGRQRLSSPGRASGRTCTDSNLGRSLAVAVLSADTGRIRGRLRSLSDRSPDRPADNEVVIGLAPFVP
jgi:hypothetical protein